MKIKIDGGQTLFWGFLFTLMIANAAAQVARKDLECTEGSRWRIDDCNWCSCITGIGSCTEKGCPLVKEDPNEAECDGISRWKEYFGGTCSQCDCRNGKKFCHPIHCSINLAKSLARGRSLALGRSLARGRSLALGRSLARGRSLAPFESNEISRRDFECTPGSRWRLNCNWCRCGLDGTGICSRRYCPPGAQNPNELQCEGVSEWKEYKAGSCSKCECKLGKSHCYIISCSSLLNIGKSNLGRLNIGKSLAVPAHNEVNRRDFECTSGSRWREKCNWCRCALDGTGFCLFGACPPGSLSPFEPECYENSEWKEIRGGLCTKCECKAGKRFCYSISCTSPVSIGKSLATPAPNEIVRRNYQCIPGSRFRDNCNWCRCSADGIGICTRRVCVPGVTYSDQCIGSSSWRTYKNGQCSWCECRHEKAFCNPVLC